jgi:hypothetical protein
LTRRIWPEWAGFNPVSFISVTVESTPVEEVISSGSLKGASL